MTEKYAQVKTKLQLIFWPYLRLVLLFVASYGLVDGALLTGAPSFEPSETLRELALPALLGTGLVGWFLWPRLRLLVGSGKRRDLRLLLALLALVYAAAGLGGSLASLVWHFETLSVGASGAIFGLMGATLVLGWRAGPCHPA